MEITIRKYRYGEQRLTSFSFNFETQEVYLPNFEDLYIGQRETEFERIINEPESLTASITHEFLHFWLNGNFNKIISAQLDNIDKNGTETEYRLSSINSKLSRKV